MESHSFSDFIDSVFNALRSNENNSAPAGDVYARTVDNFVTVVEFLTHQFKGLHPISIEQFFNNCLVGRRNVFALLTYHCAKIYDSCKDVFMFFLYTCCFGHYMIIYCRKRSLQDYETLIPLCIKEICNVFQEEFDTLGGLKGLREILNSKIDQKLFYLVTLCYSGNNFITYVPISERFYVFGTCMKEVRKEFLRTIQRKYLQGNFSDMPTFRAYFSRLNEALQNIIVTESNNVSSSTIPTSSAPKTPSENLSAHLNSLHLSSH